MKLALIIAGAVGGYLYYKYSKMSADERRDMMNKVKEKGKKLYDDYVPDNLKDMGTAKS
jgi:hypothetical protein